MSMLEAVTQKMQGDADDRRANGEQKRRPLTGGSGSHIWQGAADTGMCPCNAPDVDAEGARGEAAAGRLIAGSLDVEMSPCLRLLLSRCKQMRR